MPKRITLTILALLLVIVLLGGIKYLQIRKMIDQGKHFVPPPAVVTTARVEARSWEATLTATGSLSAVQGVTVAAEIPGKVVEIAFRPGSTVMEGDLLVRLDTAPEEAQLRMAEAAVALAKINLDRARDLIKKKSMARAGYDTAESNYRQAVAQADSIRATIGKKIIRAPFSGRLGIRLVNPGQILGDGDPIVTLQSLHTLFVNFLLPQQHLHQLRPDLLVRVHADTLSGRSIEGRITAINPEIDRTTRNIRVQALVTNPDELLLSGMFVRVIVILPEQDNVLAIPATAVHYAPYGDSVFLVETKKDAQHAETPGKTVHQQFIRLGRSRGDFVAVRSGLSEGQVVVSSGVFKLRNGQAVKVNNSLTPKFELAPRPANN